MALRRQGEELRSSEGRSATWRAGAAWPLLLQGRLQGMHRVPTVQASSARTWHFRNVRTDQEDVLQHAPETIPRDGARATLIPADVQRHCQWRMFGLLHHFRHLSPHGRSSKYVEAGGSGKVHTCAIGCANRLRSKQRKRKESQRRTIYEVRFT